METANGEEVSSRPPLVRYMRLRQAIRAARTIYCVTGALLVALGVSLWVDRPSERWHVGSLLLALAGFHAVAFVRVLQQPLPWARRMAHLAYIEFAVAVIYRQVSPELPPWRPTDFMDLFLPIAGVAIAWDAVPRGEDAERIAEHPQEWRDYVQRYDRKGRAHRPARGAATST